MNTRTDPIPSIKKQVAEHIVAAMGGWSQSWAASYLGTQQPRVSDLRAGKLGRFSLEKLIRMLARIDHGVALEIRCPRASLTCDCGRRGDSRRAAQEPATGARRSGN
jgi:predicted XRE-type DNA-binding protein